MSPESATCGRRWKTGPNFTISIDADHLEMVKFSESDRDECEKVLDILQDFLQSAKLVIETRLYANPGKLSTLTSVHTNGY